MLPGYYYRLQGNRTSRSFSWPHERRSWISDAAPAATPNVCSAPPPPPPGPQRDEPAGRTDPQVLRPGAGSETADLIRPKCLPERSSRAESVLRRRDSPPPSVIGSSCSKSVAPKAPARAGLRQAHNHPSPRAPSPTYPKPHVTPSRRLSAQRRRFRCRDEDGRQTRSDLPDVRKTSIPGSPRATSPTRIDSTASISWYHKLVQLWARSHRWRSLRARHARTCSR